MRNGRKLSSELQQGCAVCWFGRLFFKMKNFGFVLYEMDAELIM